MLNTLTIGGFFHSALVDIKGESDTPLAWSILFFEGELKAPSISLGPDGVNMGVVLFRGLRCKNRPVRGFGARQSKSWWIILISFCSAAMATDD